MAFRLRELVRPIFFFIAAPNSLFFCLVFFWSVPVRGTRTVNAIYTYQVYISHTYILVCLDSGRDQHADRQKRSVWALFVAVLLHDLRALLLSVFLSVSGWMMDEPEISVC